MEPLEPGVRLYESAVQAIQQYILKERLKPGDALPSERQIQLQLGISRAPVREALRVLQRVGMIEARHGKGVFVKEMNLRPMVDTFVSHLELLDGDSFDHLLGLRYAIEIGAAELAARHRTDEDLAEMAAILAAMEQRIESNELVIGEDMGFHELLVEATHNPLLVQLYSCLTPFLIAVRERRAPSIQELESCRIDHTAIYEAVRDQDRALVTQLMQEHMNTVAGQFQETRDKNVVGIEGRSGMA